MTLGVPVARVWASARGAVDTGAIVGPSSRGTASRIASATFTEGGMATDTTGVTGTHRASIEARTLRGDRWWLSPLTRSWCSRPSSSTRRPGVLRPDYYASPYLSPFYSPCLGDCVEGASDFGQPFAWWPLSAALIILIFPLGFRMTCYYYRKAYYRAFWLSPPACGVAEPHEATPVRPGSR